MSRISGRSGSARKRWIAAAIGVLALSVTAACGGSAMDPHDVALANASVDGTGGNGSTPSGGSTAVGDAPLGSTPDNQPGSSPSTGTDTPGSSTPNAPSGGASSGGGGGGGAPATGAGVKAGSCAGFKNQTGITSSTINLATIADVTGPVPAIFKPAIDATKAYAAYFNSTSNICGRKLAIDPLDSQTNASGDLVGAQKACEHDFASIGSTSSFDSGGSATVEKCGLPDLHAVFTTPTRMACTVCFGTEAPPGGYYQGIIPDYFTRTNKAATQKVGFIYVGVAASVAAAEAEIRAQKRAGWKIAYSSSFDIAEFNYAPYVQKMKSAGVRLVEFLGSSNEAISLANAMQQADFKPDIFLVGGTQYDKIFANAGSAVQGAIIYLDFVPFEESSTSAEERLYFKWLQQVAPGTDPTYFGLFAWSAARLFAQQATALGGQLTRANLIKSFRTVHAWTSNGLHAPQDVGGKKIGQCWRFLQLKGSTWVPYGPRTYSCGRRIDAR